MAKVNHHSLKYKRMSLPNKKYKELKAKQKSKLAQWMFWEVCSYYKETGAMPDTAHLDALAQKVYHRVEAAAIWVPYEAFSEEYKRKLPHFEKRISEHGIAQEASKKKIPASPRKQRRYKKKREEYHAFESVQDDRFYFIAGYTSGGAPFGVTWEEMGLEPYDEIE